MCPHAAIDRPPVATRVDVDTRIRETVSFLGSGEHKLACTTHVPLDQPVTGVVICASICNDFLRNYAREVELARTLAASGVAVARFHYRGTGNSDGDESEVTFDSMVADGREVTRHLRALTGVERLVFVGTRFGAPIAAALANREPGAPLVLVEPSDEASRFFREAWRAASVVALAKAGRGAIAPNDLVDELHERGVVDVLGHDIHRALFDSSVDRTLLGELDDRQRPVLVLQFGKALRPRHESLVTALTEAGATVDVEVLGSSQLWWVIDEDERPPDAFAPTVLAWPPLRGSNPDAPRR
jgi:pimeloyl-ACP methyl ester carboxylesterase